MKGPISTAVYELADSLRRHLPGIFQQLGRARIPLSPNEASVALKHCPHLVPSTRPVEEGATLLSIGFVEILAALTAVEGRKLQVHTEGDRTWISVVRFDELRRKIHNVVRNGREVSFRVKGMWLADQVIQAYVKGSQRIAFMPYPDDEYELTVQGDSKGTLMTVPGLDVSEWK